MSALLITTCTPSLVLRPTLVYWAISVAWVLSLVLLSFNGVTVAGGLIATTIAGTGVWLVYMSVQRAIPRA